MAKLSVTHITDPGCPFAYSAMPFLTALQWRYGDQLSWRHVMIGLTEDRSEYEGRGYTPLKMAQGQRMFRRFGQPFVREPKPRMAATARACRAVVATRLSQPELEEPVFRALQFVQFTTTLPLDDDAALREALARVPGVDVEAVMAQLDSDAVTEAYEADRALARTAEGGPTEFQGKAAQTDGPVRFTAPSLLFETEDGRTLEAGGFQPLEAYDVVIANLDTSLERRRAPSDVSEILRAFPAGLTTREVATVLAMDSFFAPDDAAAEDQLLELVDRGDAFAEPLGDSTFWIDAASPLARDESAVGAAAAA
ncbi:MAG TPA: DsbA family protein [Solirubrobacteraceae bacterium]|nr:DsbA family protein [Solirubrobacteraceae bacterium]